MMAILRTLPAMTADPHDKTYPTGLIWFRRDLRAHDHAALHRALRACRQVHAVFVFATAILYVLPLWDLWV